MVPTLDVVFDAPQHHASKLLGAYGRLALKILASREGQRSYDGETYVGVVDLRMDNDWECGCVPSESLCLKWDAKMVQLRTSFVNGRSDCGGELIESLWHIRSGT